MKHGAIFPTTEIGTAAEDIRTYARAVEDLGFEFVVLFDHVIGSTDTAAAPGGGYGSAATPFHEPLVTLTAIAAWTTRIELVTGVIVSPQRQTVLLAKQATELQILSQGRLRLGLGTGWNRLEYECLGADFSVRGKRLTEQVHLMRRLWSDTNVTFRGATDAIENAAINPRPSVSIPVWLGGTAPRALERAAQIGDGWFPVGSPAAEADRVQLLHELLRGHGRDPARFGIQGSGQYAGGHPALWRRHAERWRALGASHLAVNTQRAGFATVDDHVRGLNEYISAVRSLN